MKRHDPLMRVALQLQQRLQQRAEFVEQGERRRWLPVQEQARLVLQRLARSDVAHRRRWAAAAQITSRSAADALRELQYAVNGTLSQLDVRTPRQPASLSDLYQELEQLESEFGGMTADPKRHVVDAITDSIELEGIELGAFRIELHLDRIAHHPDVSAFDIVALQPNPPDCSEDVTHPHVRDRQLCAGDATVPIRQALESGRIADAFMAVRAVLETYNPGSPYVSLEDWNGTPCGDCGNSTDSDHSYTCEQCGKICCEDCYSWCDVCESTFCRDCLQEDSQSGRLCCRDCRRRCGECNRIVDATSFLDETGLCPECHEQRIQEQENDDESSETDNDAGAEQPDSGGEVQPGTSPSAGAA